MDIPERLSEAGLFRDLAADEIEEIARLCRKVHQPPGRLIFKEGDKAERFGVVAEGSVELRFEIPGRSADADQNLAVVKPGKLFGWSALVPPYEMRLSSYAGPEGCTYLSFEADRVTVLFNERHRIGHICYRNLTRAIAKRFAALEDEVARLRGQDVMHGW